nr:hypothetical protein [Mycoplasmopsis bovis]
MNKYKRYNLGITRINSKIAKKVKVPAAKKDKIKWWNIRWIFKWSNKEDLIKIIKIISTDDEIKKIKKDKFKETVTKIKNSFPFKVSNKVIMSLLKIKKSTYYKKLKKLKWLKKELELKHCSSSF